MPIAKNHLFHVNANANVSRGARGLNVRVSLSLLSYFVYASNEGSGETARKRRLV